MGIRVIRLLSPVSCLLSPLLFRPFSPLHLLAVAILALLIAGLSVSGRTLASHARQRFEWTIALAIAALWLGYQVYDTVHRGFAFGHSLPLQLCDLAAIVAALEFARPSRRVHALAWFWGVALSSQALITPDLAGGPATISFWAFWLYHFFIVGSGVYAVAARGFRPQWPDLRFAIALGVAYAAVVFTIDLAFGLNYGYFGRSEPGQPTLIDVLGPWPLRVLWMVVLATVAMTLFWLPFEATARRARMRELRLTTGAANQRR